MIIKNNVMDNGDKNINNDTKEVLLLLLHVDDDYNDTDIKMVTKFLIGWSLYGY